VQCNFQTLLETNPPERCEGYGELQSISLTDWEAGMGSWTAGRHDVADPEGFQTADWAILSELRDGRPGSGVFVQNLNADCESANETGALTLDSPPILIPQGTLVPRISIDHWIATEFGFDGGNLKISIDGGEFKHINASAFEVSPYNSTLLPESDGNSNPLKSEGAFTGTDEGVSTGSWGQSHISLLGIAEAGESVQLRFDFGVDYCFGVEGWYVDEVEFYSCSDELLPSDCGNGVLDGGEVCDDGNAFIGDGCSNTCQVENGWQCTDPLPPGQILDPGFEDYPDGNPEWSPFSAVWGTPVCSAGPDGCNSTGGGTGPLDGEFWVWFGGTPNENEEGSISQQITIPTTVTELTFGLEVPACNLPADYLEVLIDGNQEFLVNGSSPLCNVLGYATQSVDISAYADGEVHQLEFHSETFSVNDNVSNFFVDVVAMPGTVSACTPETSLTLIKEVTNDNGGTEEPSAWTLTATGPTTFSGNGPSVSSGGDFKAGAYDLSESGPAGYTAGDWACAGGTQDDGDTITLAPGEEATCTITNDDIDSEAMIFIDGFEVK
jgi:cysteine-rich repeat protein